MNKKLMEEHRKAILLTASKVFAEKGYYNTRISDIAEELGVGHGTIYRYFKNKHHLFDRLLNFVVSGISDIVKSEDPGVAVTIDDYYKQMERIGWSLFQFFAENRELANVIFYFEAISISRQDKSTHKRIENFSHTLEEYNAAYLQNGIQKGFLRKDTPVQETALLINAMVFEAVRRIFTLKEKDWNKSAQTWSKTILDLVTRGIYKRVDADLQSS